MKKIKYAGVLLVGLLALLLLWGLIEPYFIDTEEQAAWLPDRGIF